MWFWVLDFGQDFSYSRSMETRKTSLRVARLEWGEVEIDDGRIYKDVKLYPGGARAWNWMETGTSHRSGVQQKDVLELIQHEADIVVLTRGVLGRLNVPEELIAWLQSKGIEVHVAKTKQAVQLYNQLCAEHRVGILIHSTC